MYATVVYQACKDIRVVQDLLGHSSVATTQVYVQVGFDAKQAAVSLVA
jgi:site-specific recombinase XerC